MKPVTIAILLSLVICSFPETFAGETSDTTRAGIVQKIVLKDGNTFVGVVESESRDSLIVVLASGGRIVLPRSSLESMNVLKGQIVDGRYMRIDPNGSRLFFGPTARPVRAGSGYFSVYELFFPYLAVGIGDIVTLAGGITVLPGASSQLFYLGPKISFPLNSETFDLAIGGHYFNAFGQDTEGAGIVYAVTTIGGQMASVTIGGGYGFVEGEFSENPLLMVGGEVQLSNSAKLISENWFPLSSGSSLLSFGVRFFGENLSADFGFYYPMTSESSEGFPFIPWLGFSYAFGK
jgi:hypothetical protein